MISLKRDLLPNPHPLLTMDDTINPKSNSIKVLGFKFDSLLTWEPQIIDIQGRARQRAGQLYHCHSSLTKQDMCTIYKSWIYPTLEYGSIIQELLILIYIILIICSHELNGHFHSFFNHSLTIKKLQL